MAARGLSFRLLADTGDASLKLKDVSGKLEQLTARAHDVRLDADDKPATIKLREIGLQLDKLGKRVARPSVSTEGITRAGIAIDKLSLKLDELGRKDVDVSVGVRRTLLSRLDFLGGAGESGGGGLSGLLGGLGPIGMGTGLTLAASMAPALIPALLGGGIGGLGALGAYKLDPKAFRPAIRQAKSAGTDALTGRGTGIFGQMPGFNPVFRMPQGPQGSFVGGLSGILSQIAGFIHSIGPELGSMFRDSLPVVRSFVTVMEQFAKAALPAISGSLLQLKESGALKLLTQGFVILAQGMADFIQRLGPGMKDAAIIFKTAAIVIKDTLIAVGNSVNWLSHGIVNAAEGAKIFAHDTAHYFDEFRRTTASLFDEWRHSWAHIWDAIWQDTLGTAITNIRGIDSNLARWYHDAVGIFTSLKNSASNVWANTWSGIKTLTTNGISAVTGFFRSMPGKVTNALGSLGTDLKNLGNAAMHELWSGITSVASPILNWFKSFGSSIASAFKKVLGIFSPSSVFHQFGLDIAHGLANGIHAGVNKHVTSAIGAMHGAALSGPPSAAMRFAQGQLPAYGWGGQWPALFALWQRESGWNANAVNPSSGAYGIPQALGHGHPFNLGDYANQIRWGLAYIRGRYGSPDAAWRHEEAFGWYGKGLSNAVFSRPTIIGVGESGPELVNVTPMRSRAAAYAAAVGGDVINVNVSVPPSANTDKIANEIWLMLRDLKRHRGGQSLNL